MELKSCQIGLAFVKLEPSDCAKLAKLCDAAHEAFDGALETETLAEAARTYGAAFRALALATTSLEHVRHSDLGYLSENLVDLGLKGLFRTPEEALEARRGSS